MSESTCHPALLQPIQTMSRLRKARAFFHDLPNRSFSASGGAPPRVTDLTRENCERIFQILRDTPLELSELQYIQTLLNRCPRSDNLLDPIDDKGWNLLQKAVICNQAQVVTMLIVKGVDFNYGSCSLPLHLACKMGHAQIVSILLDNGARPDLNRGVCYPVSHLQKSGKQRNRCKVRHPQPALGYALPNDREEVVRVLLAHRNSRDLIKKDCLLHEACKCRARRCLKLLVEYLPEQVNIRDKAGLTPLQHALRGPRNRESAIILLESDAEFYPDIFETDYGTLLHELYVSDDTSFFLRLTELMLEKGPEDLAMRITKGDGDTLLNKLLKFFGGTTPRDRDQYVNEVKECIRLLISHGCDPNHANKKGETALHSLLAHHGGRPLFYIRDRFGVGPQYLGNLLAHMCSLMEVLLEKGENANIMLPPNVVSPMYYLMRVVCAMSPLLLSLTSEQVKNCIRILCQNGADPNVINAFGDNTLTLLLGSLSRWLYHASDDPSRLESLLIFTEDALRLFLKYGLNPQAVLKKNLKQFVIIFNSTILDRSFIRHLNQLLKNVIRAGGDPNLIKLSELHGGGPHQSYATKYTVGYYLARGLYIHARYQNQAAFEILDVFRNTLRQDLLTQWVDAICANLSEEFEHGAHNLTIQRRIKCMCEKPRSLKQLCRIAIYTAVNWKLEEYCTKLPLPHTLISYLVRIEQ
jgi:ankyrin repeat protein